ncbi:hypothetical protein OG943_20330 [Amycolatopsis sp. NBC_00345]|uniref:hypothetical protein n=1 Tax=Amycolatopsis sp. NBC_00345 TaxID=2975955 RepID=UPI002E2773AA
MNPITLVDLARLFHAAVTADPAVPAELPGGVPRAERERVGAVLTALLADPEDERMLRLPLTGTDMVDFEIPVEVGPK